MSAHETSRIRRWIRRMRWIVAVSAVCACMVVLAAWVYSFSHSLTLNYRVQGGAVRGSPWTTVLEGYWMANGGSLEGFFGSTGYALLNTISTGPVFPRQTAAWGFKPEYLDLGAGRCMVRLEIHLGWPALLFGLLAVISCPRRRRPIGRCTRCDYDLRGNQSGICPECGGVVSGDDSPEAMLDEA